MMLDHEPVELFWFSSSLPIDIVTVSILLLSNLFDTYS